MANNSYYSSLPNPEKKRYEKKVELISKEKYSNSVDPYEISDDWIDDISLWPPVEYGDIHNYLIETPGPYTREKLRAYKSLDAYNYYINGYVQTVFYYCYQSNRSVCILKARVRASQRTTVLHLAWVAVKKDGSILTGHCKCMAGCGEVCSHVAAILFKVEACIRLKIVDMSCTSLPCTWNQSFSEKTNPSPVIDINFEKPLKRMRKEGENGSSGTRNTPEDFTPTISRNVLLQHLHSACPKAVIYTVVAGFSSTSQNLPDTQASNSTESNDTDEDTIISTEPSTPITDSPEDLLSGQCNLIDTDGEEDATELDLPLPLSALFDPDVTDSVLQEAYTAAFKSIEITETQAKNLAESTKEQAESDIWMEHRKGRITASKMHSVIKCKRKQYPLSIVKSIMQYHNNINIPALQWGRNNEDVARQQYVSMMEQTHINFLMSQSGLIVDPNMPFLGATPDGFAHCDCCGDRLIEIKCPYSVRDKSPVSDEALERSRYCLKKENNVISLKRSHEYFTQVQGQLLVCRKKKCDFICWTPKGMHVETILEYKTLQCEIASSCKDFFMTFILPELLTHRLQDHGIPLVNETEKVYCYCGKGEYGDMIACDNPDCTLEWFHYECVGITRSPKGEWFCDNCKSVQ